MKQSSWRELELIFNEAIGLPTERRLAFLSTVCGKNKSLYRNVLMLLRMRPFDGNTPVDIQSNILHSEPLFNSKIEQFSLLKDILLKLLTKQRAERYQTATDLKEDLRIVYRNLSAEQQNLNIHLTCDGKTAQSAGNLRAIRQRLEKFIKNILSR